MNDSEATKMEPLWFDQWTSTVNACFDGLEPNDLRQVQSHGSWDDVQEQLKKGSSDRPTTMNFASVKTGLPRFRTFVEDWLQKVSTDLDRSVPWGLTRLIIKLLQEETAAIPHILPMLCNTYKELGKFNSYFNEFETFTPELKEHCVEASVILVGFLTAIVKFMRNDMPLDGRPSSGITWQPLDTAYLSTISKMDQLLASLKDLSKQAHRPNRPKRNSSDKQEWSISQPLLTDEPPRYHLLDDDAKLPYVGLPSSTRTSRFFDRDNVIGIIEKHFDSSPPSSSFLSITLHGLGGVGKSTVALKYAEKKLKHEELDALLWVHSEKLVTISQSFTDIAMRLKLPDARQGDHEENRALVLNWLQKTRCRWLIVYDNAEDPNLIRPYWPVASRCRAIITTRNPSFKFELTGAGFEVREWDKEAGHKFLLHLLKTDIRSCLDETEVTSALELSEKLSGHALAIATMAGVIHDRAMSIKEFMEFYNQDPGEVLGSFGNKFMTALWKASFKTLDPNSQALLGVMSFLEPDSIPEIMFSPPSPSDLPSSLSFCCNFLPFSDATGNLLKRALIKRDSKSRTLSLHRMVQTASKYFMTPQQRQQAFNDATIVVSKAFPRRDSTVAQMYLMWEKCALYLRHVISLKDCFREEKKSNPDFVPLQTYCDLNNACQRYLLELNSYEELEGLIEVNTLALESLPKEQQLVGLWGSLTSHKGQLLCRLGRVEEGVEWLKQSYDIRSRDVPFRPQESAWAADNAATGIATSNNFEEAIIWYNRARDHYLEWSNQQPERKGQWPAAIMRSMGMGLIWSGRREEAKKLLQGALEQVESTKPYNWAVAAGTHFGLGTVDRFDGRYDEAEMHFMEAQNSWLKGDQMRSDPFNGACMYRLGCVALDQGLVEAAVKHLRDALVITEKRKDILIAEHARCLFKLSEALEQDSKSENEARSTRDEAERLLKQRGPDDLDPGKEISYDSLVYMSWR